MMMEKMMYLEYMAPMLKLFIMKYMIGGESLYLLVNPLKIIGTEHTEGKNSTVAPL